MTAHCLGGYRHSRFPAGSTVTCPVCGHLVRVRESSLYGWAVIEPHPDLRHPANWRQLQLPYSDDPDVTAEPDPNP